ncbi:hypothetical protein GQ53DRAFT_248541 [Thozetella sp. PMI_491]|nr:hypothetical protein GQ53DRAFT_248541 [Thozetella sp. PMI_491]
MARPGGRLRGTTMGGKGAAGSRQAVRCSYRDPSLHASFSFSFSPSGTFRRMLHLPASSHGLAGSHAVAYPSEKDCVADHLRSTHNVRPPLPRMNAGLVKIA